MLKKSFLLKICVLAAFAQGSAYASQLISGYAELADSMDSGHTVQAVIEPSKCVAKEQGFKEKRTHVLSWKFDRLWRYTPENENASKILAFDNLMAKSPVKGVEYVNVELEVSQDNKAELTVEYIDPTNFSTRGKVEYVCQVSDGKDGNGVSLFEIGG